MKIQAPASEQAQQSQSASQTSSLIAKAESTFEDSRTEAKALRPAQNMAGDNPHNAQLRSRQVMMAASPRVQQLKSIQKIMVNKTLATVSVPATPGTQVSLANNIVQNYFTAKGDKAKKLRQWISATKKALADNGEIRLLEFFNEKVKSSDEIEWDDVRESYAMTRLKLRQMLDGETDAPLTLMDEEYPTEKLAGAKSATGRNRLAAWDIQNRGVLDPRSHTELAHVSKKADWMSERIDTTHGADKGELGQGFYTVSGHSDAAAEGIRNEFGEDGKEPRDVLKFRIANTEIIKMVGGDPGLGAFLVFVLQNTSGYPDRADVMGSINAINKLGMALIFPDKTTKVDIDDKGTKHSYESYREINGAAGSHSLIIGPQARESLDGIRQICARGYLGDKIINEAPRSEKRMAPRPKKK